MATSQVFRGRVAVDALTVGGVRIDPSKAAEGDGGDGGDSGGGVVPQPVPSQRTIAALTAALVEAGVLVEDGDGGE